jgi:hypothetical protein
MTETTENADVINEIKQYVQAQFAAMSANQIANQQELIAQQTLHQQEMDTNRRNHESQMESRRIKMDMIKVATDTLAANAKSKPADERDVTASDIKTFADELIEYINQE